MRITAYRRPGTRQYLCLSCGFQSGAMIFKAVQADGENKTIACPDCNRFEVVDADTKARINLKKTE